MKQFNLIKRFRTAIVIVITILTIGILNGCNSCNDSTKSETKDSTTNTMSDSSRMRTDTMTRRYDSLHNRKDTGRGDQPPPPPR